MTSKTTSVLQLGRITGDAVTGEVAIAGSNNFGGTVLMSRRWIVWQRTWKAASRPTALYAFNRDTHRTREVETNLPPGTDTYGNPVWSMSGDEVIAPVGSSIQILNLDTGTRRSVARTQRVAHYTNLR